MPDHTAIIALIGLATTVGSFFAGFRMRFVKTTGIEIENLQKAIATWRELVDFQATEIVRLDTKIAGLKKEIKDIMRLQNESFFEHCKTCIYRIDKNIDIHQKTNK